LPIFDILWTLGPFIIVPKFSPFRMSLSFFGPFAFFGLSLFQADFATLFCDSNFQAQYLAKKKQHAAEICSVC